MKRIIISQYIPIGKENAVTAGYLSKLLGINKRHVVRLIRNERLQGVKICASCSEDPKGYFLAQDDEDTKKFCAGLKHRVKETNKVIKELEHE